MPFEPAIDFVRAMDGASASFTFNTNIFAGEERAPKKRGRVTVIPEEGVFCLENGGRPIDIVHDAPGADESDVYWVRIEAVIRSKRNDFDGGQALARLVRQTGHKLAVTQFVGGAVYIDCLSVGSGPTYLVDDDTEHHRWLQEFELAFEE